MRRDDYRGSDLGRDRDFNREYERDNDRDFESQSRGMGMRDYGGNRGMERDFDRYDYSREDYGRDRGAASIGRGYARDYDEDRGFGYGRSSGGGERGNMGYGGMGAGAQTWQSGRGFGGGYQGFQGNRNDDEIEHEIYDRIDNDGQIPDNADIQVSVRDKVVTLSGNVRNRNAKMAAWNCVWQVQGVEDVFNNITITSRRRQAGGMGQNQGMGQSANQGISTGGAGQSQTAAVTSGTETSRAGATGRAGR